MPIPKNIARGIASSWSILMDCPRPSEDEYMDRTRHFILRRSMVGKCIRTDLIVEDSTPNSRWTAIDLRGVTDIQLIAFTEDEEYLHVHCNAVSVVFKVMDPPAPDKLIHCSVEPAEHHHAPAPEPDCPHVVPPYPFS